jgi:hydroxyethylthiazole kinase
VPIAILRLNAGEATALLSPDSASSSFTGHGVDAPDPAIDTVDLADGLACRYGCVAAVTGQTDAISDGQRVVLIDNGDPLLTRVTGTGDMATGIIAACAAVESDMLRATAAGLLAFGVAGEIAVRHAHGPGSLRPALLDALSSLDTTTLVHEGRVRWS